MYYKKTSILLVISYKKINNCGRENAGELPGNGVLSHGWKYMTSSACWPEVADPG